MAAMVGNIPLVPATGQVVSGGVEEQTVRLLSFIKGGANHTDLTLSVLSASSSRQHEGGPRRIRKQPISGGEDDRT